MGSISKIKSKGFVIAGISLVAGSVISGLASAAYPDVRAWFIKLFDKIGAFFSWIWSSLVSPYPIPGWILLLISIVLVPVLVMAVNKLIKRPLYYSYVSDHISGANWEWEWSWGAIESLRCFCVYCKAQLVDEQYDTYESTTHFFCENCNERHFSVHGGRLSYVHDKVKREIDRRIRMNQMKINKI